MWSWVAEPWLGCGGHQGPAAANWPASCACWAIRSIFDATNRCSMYHDVNWPPLCWGCRSARAWAHFHRVACNRRRICLSAGSVAVSKRKPKAATAPRSTPPRGPRACRPGPACSVLRKKLRVEHGWCAWTARSRLCCSSPPPPPARLHRAAEPMVLVRCSPARLFWPSASAGVCWHRAAGPGGGPRCWSPCACCLPHRRRCRCSSCRAHAPPPPALPT